jgi:hypothetical protein
MQTRLANRPRLAPTVLLAALLVALAATFIVFGVHSTGGGRGISSAPPTQSTTAPLRPTEADAAQLPAECRRLGGYTC